MYDIENLRLAHKNARKGKAFYKEVKEIDKDPDKYLYQLQEMLISKTYKTSEYEIFTKLDKNKEREICKLPYFPDRVCQWALLQIIEPYLVRTFTSDTYSAIPNRGAHLALNRMRKTLTTDKLNTKYCLKLDARKYYASINHEILKQKYRRVFKDENLLWLIFEIIDSTDGDTGIPIGNYLSQYSGNFYLSEFDHWIKEQTRVFYYYRYMDDIVILCSNKRYLHELLLQITDCFKQNLKLDVKANWQIFPVDVRGIDFVGYRCFRKFTLLRKSIAKTLKRKCFRYLKRCERGNALTHKEWCSINSYKGWTVHCDCYRLTDKYITPLQPHCLIFYNKTIKGKVEYT